MIFESVIDNKDIYKKIIIYNYTCTFLYNKKYDKKNYKYKIGNNNNIKKYIQNKSSKKKIL